MTFLPTSDLLKEKVKKQKRTDLKLLILYMYKMARDIAIYHQKWYVHVQKRCVYQQIFI